MLNSLPPTLMATMPDMAKYRMEPRFATETYSARVFSISSAVFAAVSKDTPIWIEVASTQASNPLGLPA